MRIKNIITELIIFFLLIIWAFTFVSKIFDFDTFARQIRGAYILADMVDYLPHILQALHLIIVILLLNKKWRKLGMITSLSVLLLYTGYLVYILKFAPSIPCSCIAIFKGMNWNGQLYCNFILLAVNIIGLITFSMNRTPHSTHIQTTYN